MSGADDAAGADDGHTCAPGRARTGRGDGPPRGTHRDGGWRLTDPAPPRRPLGEGSSVAGPGPPCPLSVGAPAGTSCEPVGCEPWCPPGGRRLPAGQGPLLTRPRDVPRGTPPGRARRPWAGERPPGLPPRRGSMPSPGTPQGSAGAAPDAAPARRRRAPPRSAPLLQAGNGREAESPPSACAGVPRTRHAPTARPTFHVEHAVRARTAGAQRSLPRTPREDRSLRGALRTGTRPRSRIPRVAGAGRGRDPAPGPGPTCEQAPGSSGSGRSRPRCRTRLLRAAARPRDRWRGPLPPSRLPGTERTDPARSPGSPASADAGALAEPGPRPLGWRPHGHGGQAEEGR